MHAACCFNGRLFFVSAVLVYDTTFWVLKMCMFGIIFAYCVKSVNYYLKLKNILIPSFN